MDAAFSVLSVRDRELDNQFVTLCLICLVKTCDRIRGFGVHCEGNATMDDPGWTVESSNSSNHVVTCQPPLTPVPQTRNPLRAEVNSVLPWYGLPPSGCAGLLITGDSGAGSLPAENCDVGLAAEGQVDEDVFAFDGSTRQQCYCDILDVFSGSPSVIRSLGAAADQADPSVHAEAVSEVKTILVDALWSSVVQAMEPAVHAIVAETIAEFVAALPKRVSSRNVYSYHPVMPAFEEENSSDFSEEDTPTSVRVQSRLGANFTPFQCDPLNVSSSTGGSLVVTLPVPPLAFPVGSDPHVQSSLKISPADLQTLLSPVVVQRRTTSSTPVPPLTPVVIAPSPPVNVPSKDHIRVTPTLLVLSPRKPSPSPRMSPVVTGFHRAPSPVAIPSPKLATTHASGKESGPLRPLAVVSTPTASHRNEKPSPRDRTPSVERESRGSPMSRHRRAKQGKLKVLISEDGEDRSSCHSSASPSLLVGPPLGSTASATSRPSRVIRQPMTKRSAAVSPRTLALTSPAAVHVSSQASLGDTEGVTGVRFGPKRRGRPDVAPQPVFHQSRVTSAKAIAHKRQSSLTGLWSSVEGAESVSKRPITAGGSDDLAAVTDFPLPRSAHRKARILPAGHISDDTLVRPAFPCRCCSLKAS
jgi:hypothetical protein